MRLKNLVVTLFHPVEFLPFNKEINLLISSKLAGIGEKEKSVRKSLEELISCVLFLLLRYDSCRYHLFY